MLKKTLLSLALATSLFSKDFFVSTDKEFETTLLKIVKESYINKNINYYVNNIYIESLFKLSKNRIVDYKKFSKLGKKLEQKKYRIKIFKNNKQLNKDERIFSIPKWYVCEYQNICNIKDNMEFFRYDYKDSIINKKFISLNDNKKTNNIQIKNNHKSEIKKEKIIINKNMSFVKKPNIINKQRRIDNIINNLMKTKKSNDINKKLIIGIKPIKKEKLKVNSSLKKQNLIISKNKPFKKQNINDFKNSYSLISKYHITNNIEKKKNILKELRDYRLKEEVIDNIYKDILNYKNNKNLYIIGLNTISLHSSNVKYKKELGKFLMSHKSEIPISEVQLAYSILNIY